MVEESYIKVRFSNSSGMATVTSGRERRRRMTVIRTAQENREEFSISIPLGLIFIFVGI